MTPAELVAGLEARGVTLRPTERGTLAVRPADAVTPEEVAALRRAKPEVLSMLSERLVASMGALREDYEERAAIMQYDGGLACPEAERRAWALFPWPATLEGASRIVGPLASCARCPDDAHPSRRTTWVRYGQTPLCLAHTLEAEKRERPPA